MFFKSYGSLEAEIVPSNRSPLFLYLTCRDKQYTYMRHHTYLSILFELKRHIDLVLNLKQPNGYSTVARVLKPIMTIFLFKSNQVFLQIMNSFSFITDCIFHFLSYQNNITMEPQVNAFLNCFISCTKSKQIIVVVQYFLNAVIKRCYIN